LLELDLVLSEIKREKPGGNKILEIGAGSGWQAKKLNDSGYSVEAIDVESSNYSEHKVWPIKIYDGEHIPFPDDYFDIIFSSNVLENIHNVLTFQHEMKRTLKAGGIAIHVVPSGTWRFWTNISHYPYIIKTTIKIILKKLKFTLEKKPTKYVLTEKSRRLSKLGFLRKIVLPPRHGEVGTAITEIYYFSKCRWKKVFTKTDWKIDRIIENRLFYTGSMLFSSLVPHQVRRVISYVAGSSCHIFILKNNVAARPHSKSQQQK